MHQRAKERMVESFIEYLNVAVETRRQGNCYKIVSGMNLNQSFV